MRQAQNEVEQKTNTEPKIEGETGTNEIEQKTNTKLKIAESEASETKEFNKNNLSGSLRADEFLNILTRQIKWNTRESVVDNKFRESV